MYRWRPKKPDLLRISDRPEGASDISAEISIEGDLRLHATSAEAPVLDLPIILAKPSATASAGRRTSTAERRESPSARLHRFILQTASSNARDARRLGYLLIEAAERAYDLNDI